MLKIDELIMEARRSSDQESLEVLKLIKAELIKAQVSEKRKNPKDPLSDQEETAVLRKMCKTRKDAKEIYVNSGRLDLAEKERKELEFISKFLPDTALPTEKELFSGITDLFGSLGLQITMKSMGQIMKAAKEKYPEVDPSELSRITKEVISLGMK